MQDGDTDEGVTGMLSFDLLNNFTRRQEGRHVADTMLRGFREMIPCVASSAADAGRHSLGHSYPTGTEFRVLWIKLHGPSDEYLSSGHVLSKTRIWFDRQLYFPERCTDE